MASIRVILYTSKRFQDGRHPVMLQIIHQRKTTRKSLPVKLYEWEWDFKQNLPKKTAENYKTIISYIRSQLVIAEKAMLDIENENQDYCINDISNKMAKKPKKITFNKYSKELIEQMYTANRIGNATAYQLALNAVNNFTGNKELNFSDIDFNFLSKFESYHLSKGNSINGFGVYIRTVRAIFNKAIKEGILKSEQYPFKTYKIKRNKTIKRAISKVDIIKIKNLDFPSYSDLWHARNYFLFSFYTIGMSWVDMANLKRSNIVDDRIIYKRSKTKKEYSIRLNENIKSILEIYLLNNDEFIFPIISAGDNELQKRKDIIYKNRWYNHKLNKIAKMANIDANLTSYVSRHSWASIANFSGVSIGIISQGLGHEDIKTTQTYLADFEHTEIDKVNDNILLDL